MLFGAEVNIPAWMAVAAGLVLFTLLVALVCCVLWFNRPTRQD